MRHTHSQPRVDELTCAAGRATGHGGGETRQGSALLIVIGTLALISVFAVVYISIGRSDRLSAKAVQTRKDLVDSSEKFGDYLADVIARDRLDAVVMHATLAGANDVFGRREVTDAPYTRWDSLSESNSNNGDDLFTPWGGVFAALSSNTPALDYRVASDPWLSSSVPEYLGDPGFQGNERPFSTFVVFDPMLPNAKNFLDNRDWLQISNFAPDGRFVNLFNLRPNAGYNDNPLTGPFGGFYNEPGEGVYNNNGRNYRRMSNYLSLWKMEDPLDPESAIQAFDPSVEGIWLPGQNAPVPVITGADVFNTPAVFTMYQRFMFFPINQPFETLNRNGDRATWADPDYPLYQYADADGDGMADSRWFELTSARDVVARFANSPREDVEVGYNNKDYRFFIAAISKDLSSMVNVNTATDLLVPSTKLNPLGATPADIDLRRLLTMQDSGSNFSSYQQSNTVFPLSYQALHRPYVAEGEPLNGTPDPFKNVARNVSDYWYYQHSPASLASPDLRSLEDNSTSMLAGRYAYSALRQGIQLGSSLSDAYRGYDISFPQLPTTRQDLLQYETDPTDTTSPVLPQISTELRIKQYMDIGRLDLTNLGTSLSRGSEFGNSHYSIDDLAELLTFHGLNDPDITSRLERVTSGRYESPTADFNQTRRLGPLMSNRPLSLDRQNHGYAQKDITSNPTRPRTLDEPPSREINGRVSFNSMALFALSPRDNLTTISGFVPLVPNDLVLDPSSPSALTDASVAPSLSSALLDANQLFEIYSGALASELDTPLSSGGKYMNNALYWPTDPMDFQMNEASTLFYGHRGPELALRMAAHTAVNMKDLSDSDQEPSVATLILDNSVRDALITNFDDENSTAAAYLHHPGRATNTVFDPGEANLLTNRYTAAQDHRKAVDVFGIEPMPILTEVASLYVYTDARVGEGPPDFNPGEPRRFGNTIVYPTGPRMKVKINGNLDPEDNTDFKLQLIAFQLTNPFDSDITLGGTDLGEPMDYIDDPTNTNLKFDYYIEFGGRFFKLGEFLDFNPLNPPFFDPATYPDAPAPDSAITLSSPKYQYRSATIPANSSRVFYAIGDGRFDSEDGASGRDTQWLNELEAVIGSLDIYHDIVNYDADGDGRADGLDTKGWTGPAEEWVVSQLRVRSGMNPVHIHQFNPETGALVEEDGFHDLLNSPDTPVYDTSDRKHDFKETRLWRKIVGNLEEKPDGNPGTPPAGSIQENRIQNDMLVDRISAPADDWFIRTIAVGDNELEGTYGYTTDYTFAEMNSVGVRNDNYGLTIARWANVRRGDNAQNSSVPQLGQVTSWMMSSRDGTLNTTEGKDPFGAAGVILDASIFYTDDLASLDSDQTLLSAIKPDYEVHPAFYDFFVNSQSEEIIQTIVRRPSQKHAVTDGFTPPFVGFVDRFLAEYLGPNARGEMLHDSASDLRPEMLTNSEGFIEAPRLADLLLAWGIGPTYTSEQMRNPNDISFDSNEEGRQWVTLPEAIAIGLGFHEVTSYVASDRDADSVWYKAYDSIENKALDNGHLVLDNFVPYINASTSETPPVFTIGTDILRGNGVPMALGVIDQARAIDPLAQVTDVQNPVGAELTRQLLGQATFGAININTAPIEVLRLLPGLSPSRASYNYDPITGQTQSEWWADRFPGTNLPRTSIVPTTLSSLRNAPDVAAAIVAYRNRTYAIPNTAARPEPGSFGIYDDYPLNLSAFTPSDVINNMRSENSIVSFPAGNTPLDRATMTGIDGLRQTPGFGSLGELLALRLDPEIETLEVGRWDGLRHLMIDQFATDDLASGVENEVTIMSQLFGGDDAGLTKDDYAERISMANAVLNTISVRSDFFAVWFVVHGYQESDVANLRPEDPLVPSIKKRFLMVVDRTNVVEPGDKPKILLMKEIPL